MNPNATPSISPLAGLDVRRQPLVRPRHRPTPTVPTARSGRCGAPGAHGGRRHGVAPSRRASADDGLRRTMVTLVALVALAILIAVVVGLLTGFGGDPASASGASSASASASGSDTVRTVIAQPGDTLWALAVEHHDGVDLRRYVEALIDENGGTEIAAGQRVELP